jgi:hypothetical protein
LVGADGEERQVSVIQQVMIVECFGAEDALRQPAEGNAQAILAHQRRHAHMIEAVVVCQRGRAKLHEAQQDRKQRKQRCGRQQGARLDLKERTTTADQR